MRQCLTISPTHTHTHTHESYLLTILIQLVVPRGTEKPTDLCKAEFGTLLGNTSSSESKELACNAGDPSLTPGLGRFPEEGDGYTLQCSCLENSVDRGA